MSWHFSRALVAEYLGENSLGGEPSAPSNGTHTHGMFWSPDKTTDASIRSRSGMTYKPSTDAHGEAVLMWCLAASPVRTSPPLEKASESLASGPVCGSTWRESSAKYCLASSSWKTHRCLWEEVLEWSSLTLPKWGMMLAGVLWERITPELPTSGTESGSSPNFPTPYGLSANQGQGDGEFGKAIRNWATPCAQMANGEPEAFLERKRRSVARGNSMGVSLTDLNMQVKAAEKGMWPTPQARDHFPPRKPEYIEAKRKEGHGMSNLNDAVAHPQMFATPQARDFRTGQTSRWDNPERTRNLNDQIGGQLNPTWVEWLMGWPLGWTDCAASATDKFRE